MLTGQNISAANDAYGGAESNNGGVPVALPMYRPAAAGGGAIQACVTNAADPVPRTGNKLGSFAYVNFVAPTDRTYQFGISSPAGASPNVAIYQGGVVGRNAGSLKLSPGPYVLVINDLNNAAANTCFGVTIQ